MAPVKQLHFGFPYFYGTNTPTPDFGHYTEKPKATTPALALHAHQKPTGMCFYTGKSFPMHYHHLLFVTLAGRKVGEKHYGAAIFALKVHLGKVISSAYFVKNWTTLANNTIAGKPNDIKMMPDGALLIADSAAQNIYRISYQKYSSVHLQEKTA